VDGDPYTDTDTTLWAGDTIPAAVTSGGDEWTCTLTPSDASGPGVAGISTVEVQSSLGRTADNPAISCREVQDGWSEATNGVYWIDPLDEGAPVEVWCDMSTDDGGWTVVMYAPWAPSPPGAFGSTDLYNPDALSDSSAGFGRLSDAQINAILAYGGGADDRFRLVANGLSPVKRFYWDTFEPFDSTEDSTSSSWFQTAYSYGGEHAPPCKPPEGLGVGHDPYGSDCLAHPGFSPGSGDRVYLWKVDGSRTGADVSSSFIWYAR
jgi:hypothetical protein